MGDDGDDSEDEIGVITSALLIRTDRGADDLSTRRFDDRTICRQKYLLTYQ